MRIALALTVAAAAVAALAPSASATCFTREDGLGFRYTYCSAPGGPASTTICFRDVQPCVTYSSGGGPGGGA
ncbi:MAG TPA: hypothetical protein VGX28_12775 [Frankiaceae bacterium]|jgi:hypothetical protein|nr:hypothetical protein [Frankiaceae bacterium]